MKQNLTKRLALFLTGTALTLTMVPMAARYAKWDPDQTLPVDKQDVKEYVMSQSEVKPNAMLSEMHPEINFGKMRGKRVYDKFSVNSPSFGYRIAPTSEIGDTPEFIPGSLPIYASVVSSSDWTDESCAAIYSLATDGFDLTRVYGHPYCDATFGGCFFPPHNYMTNELILAAGGGWVYHNFFTDNPWQLNGSLQGRSGGLATDVAYDPTSDRIYGCYFENGSSTYYLGYMHPFLSNGGFDVKCYPVAPLDEQWMACAFHGDQLYAVGISGDLMKVDKKTGICTTIGNTGIPVQYASSGAIDEQTGRFYVSSCTNAGSAIYYVDLASANATLLYEMPNGEQLCGMYIPNGCLSNATPGVAQSMTLDFNKDSLAGNLSFLIPLQTNDGNEGTGIVNYEIFCDGQKLREGEGTYGEVSTAEVAVDKAGEHFFAVRLSNHAGYSDYGYTRKFLGADLPKPLEDVLLSYDVNTGTALVKWTVPSGGNNGGYYDPEALSFTVERLPANVVVAEGLKECQFSEVLDPESIEGILSYRITPIYNGTAIQPSISNGVVPGALIPPYDMIFNSKSVLESCVVIDANGDKKTWSWSSGSVSYPYHGKNAGDDWIILPAFLMESSRIYQIKTSLSAYNSSCPEKYEIFWGKTPTVEGMVNELVPATEITGRDDRVTEILPEEDGNYYIGIHAISKPDQFKLILHSVSVLNGPKVAAPAAPGLTAIADASGALKAEINVDVPTLTVDGNVSSDIEKVEIYRDGTIIFTNDMTRAGDKFSFTDTGVSNGNHEYSARAFNSEGFGKYAATSVYVGLTEPQSPTDLTVVETSPGIVELNWTAPTKDTAGHDIDASDLIYFVFNASNASNIAENIKETTFTHTACSSEESMFATYLVVATTAGGSSAFDCINNPIPVGKVYELPYREEFSDDSQADRLCLGTNSDGAKWKIVSDPSYVYDGPFLYYQATEESIGTILTAKYHVDGENSVFSFFRWCDEGAKETVDVYVNDGSGYHLVSEAASEGTGWFRHGVDMSDYSGKDVWFKLEYKAVEHNLLIDRIRFENVYDLDMGIVNISAPVSVKPGETVNVTVKTENCGYTEATGFKVALFRGETMVDEKVVEGLDPFTELVVALTDEPNVTMGRELRYSARVELDADKGIANNMSESVPVAFEIPDYPVVEYLKAESDNANAVITWTEPVIDRSPKEITDDVESYTAQSIGLAHSQVEDDYIGDWTMVDMEGGNTYNVSGRDYLNAGQPMAFTVANVDEMFSPTNSSRDAWTGHNESSQCFACIASKWAPNNDWLISPALPGVAQTVKFFAKTTTPNYGAEAFRFLVSSENTDPDTFEVIAEDYEVPGEWKEYSFELPEGTKYFAINCVSYDRYGLLIDDISFTAASRFLDLEIEGYNIYRDGIRLNESVVKDTCYSESIPEIGNHTYQVSVVYNMGESEASAGVDLDITTGVTENTEHISVSAKDGEIRVDGVDAMASVKVYTSAGLLMQSVSGNNGYTFRVSQGVYVVYINDKAYKVIVS